MDNCPCYADMYAMATSIRHNKITQGFVGDSFALSKTRKLHTFSEEIALVHYGRVSTGERLELINLDEINEAELSEIINDLEYKQPDFMCFASGNRFITNSRETRVAGCPDLIAEVWSDSNSHLYRREKLKLYTSSPITEYWSVDEKANTVECYVSGQKLWESQLNAVLTTRFGVTFDFGYLI
jgi:hypothetical protein